MKKAEMTKRFEELKKEHKAKNNHCYYCDHCTYCTYCTYCHDCDHCDYCDDCYMCVGLSDKRYCILNEQYTKEEYAKKMKEIRGKQMKKMTKIKKEVTE